MADSRKKKLIVVCLLFSICFFAVNVFLVVMATKVIPPQVVLCTDKMPKMEIVLAETTLEELIVSDKSLKYPGNTVQVSVCGEVREFKEVEIKVRGNSTWGQPKSPYQIKFSEKIDLFGMGKAKKWVLLANHYDDSNLRTDVAFYIERLLGEQYALSGEFVELTIDGKDAGLYYLTPKVEIGKTRVDLRDPIGALMELDNLHTEEEHFTVGENFLQVKDLVSEDNEETAVADFTKSLEKMAIAVKEKDLEKLSKVADVESMVRYYLLSEFTSNPDAYISSFFMYKDGEDDVIHFGPGWDFDFGLGNKKWVWAMRDDFYSPYEISIIKHYTPELDEKMIWLINSPEFFELVGEMYRERLMGRKDEVLSYLDEQAEFIWGSALDNAKMWERDFEAEYEYLREWLSNRFDYFDEYYGGMGELNKHML